ncbi:hypothetical protein DVH24_008628 [Malus domestica]|uniref:C3H1-type domain-containing protein n=1 Tax=Malus domestica TaxID=3750 RepID=A0A498JK69_MALDO|nr:hypothetical protein DVH24_008628 [Malus domestica]
MLPTARVLLPVSFTVLVEIYRYFRSGRQLELPQGVAFRLNPIDDQSGHPPSIPSHAPSDLDPEILELIRTLDPAVIEWIRNLDPAFLDEIRKIQELSLKEKEEKEKGKERETQEETEKERESEKSESGSGGGGNENGGEVVKEVVEESSTRNHPRRRENKQMMVSKDKAMQGEELTEKQDQSESRVIIYPNSEVLVFTASAWFSCFTSLNLIVSAEKCMHAYVIEIFVGDHFVLKVSKDKAKRREELAEKQDQTENKKMVSKDKAKQREELAEKQVQTESKKNVSKDKAKRREELAVKQDQTESKVFKDKPRQRGELAEKQGQTKNKVFKDNAKQRGELAEKQGQTRNKKMSMDKAKQSEELTEKQDQTGSKIIYCPGQRKGEPSVAPALKLNFLGLPIRPGKKDCLHYMRTGTCKYENNCLFNHPDPTPAEESHPQFAYESHGIHSKTTEFITPIILQK